MKQARAFGVGVIVATQNPMDLDYRALSNAGVWCLGRLQTDADRARVLDGLEDGERSSRAELDQTIKRLALRWFVVRDAHASSPPVLLYPRETMTLMRGPMTRGEIRLARGNGGGHPFRPRERGKRPSPNGPACETLRMRSSGTNL